MVESFAKNTKEEKKKKRYILWIYSPTREVPVFYDSKEHASIPKYSYIS